MKESISEDRCGKFLTWRKKMRNEGKEARCCDAREGRRKCRRRWWWRGSMTWMQKEAMKVTRNGGWHKDEEGGSNGAAQTSSPISLQGQQNIVSPHYLLGASKWTHDECKKAARGTLVSLLFSILPLFLRMCSVPSFHLILLFISFPLHLLGPIFCDYELIRTAEGVI